MRNVLERPLLPSPNSARGMNVSALHFVIHPGFGCNRKEVASAQEERHFFSEIAENRENSFREMEKRIQRYIDHARRLRHDKLLFVFLHSTPFQFKRDHLTQEPYVEMIYELRKELGRRLVVLNYDEDIFFKLLVMDNLWASV